MVVRLAEALDVVQPVHGDGTNLAFLEELGTQHAQTFVATTHEDEVNLMGTLLSKRLGAKQAIALLHRADYAGVYEALGIDATVSPRLLVSREVMRFVRRQKELIQSTIPTDGSAVFEVQVTAESALRDRRLFDQDLPHGAVTAAVTRGRALLHDPELVTLVEGDVVVVYAPDRVAAGTRRILTRRN